MDQSRVQNLNWPTDLFRDDVTGEAIDDRDNPFLEASDFAPRSKPSSFGIRVSDRQYAQAI